MTTRSLFTLRLGSHFKQSADECHLTYEVGFIYPSHVPLPHHVHHFISLQGSPCALEGKEASPRFDESFDEPMVVFDQIVEIFHVPPFNPL